MNDLNTTFKEPPVNNFVYRISHKNINQIKFDYPQNFETILFDSNLNCNLHCVYCHNHRDLNTVKEEDFMTFLNSQVSSVKNFQIGCAMEPTMDKRMGKFALMVSKSKAKPKGYFRLQTNGTLLHRHDVNELKEAGIDRITVSIDTIDSNVHKILRGGSDLEQILTNIKDLKNKWPESRVQFITTVCSLNIDKLPDLCKYAEDNGIPNIELRKMFYRPDSNVIKDHNKMKDIFISDEEFYSKTEILVKEFNKKIQFYVNGTKQLEYHRSREKIA